LKIQYVSISKFHRPRASSIVQNNNERLNSRIKKNDRTLRIKQYDEYIRNMNLNKSRYNSKDQNYNFPNNNSNIFSSDQCNLVYFNREIEIIHQRKKIII